MLERPKQDWDNHLADYVVVEHTAKDVKQPRMHTGCLRVILAALAILIAAILGGFTWLSI